FWSNRDCCLNRKTPLPAALFSCLLICVRSRLGGALNLHKKVSKQTTAPPMSALGQKQTYAVQQGMSALHLKATLKANFGKRSCPLCRRKQTCAIQLRMSAMVQ